MRADGAYGGSFFAHDEMSAVAAFPYSLLRFFKNSLHLNIVEQSAVSVLVRFFDLRDRAELRRKSGKALSVGRPSRSRRTCRSIRSFHRRGGGEIRGVSPMPSKRLEPELWRAPFSLFAVSSNIALSARSPLSGGGREIGVFVSRLRFAGKGCREIFFGFGSFEFHSSFFLRIVYFQ